MKILVIGDLEYNITQSRTEIEEVYGPPGGRVCSQGLCKLPAPIGSLTQLRCHVKIAPVLTGLFQKIYYYDENHELYGCLESVACYSDRPKTGANPMRQSVHSWGIPIDLNSKYNPFRRKPPQNLQQIEACKDGEQYGRVFYEDHPVVQIAKEFGFLWMGDSANISTINPSYDAMHFQPCENY